MEHEELAQLIKSIIKEELKPINEKLELIETINIRQEIIQNKLNNLEFKTACIDNTVRKGFHKNNQDIETLVEVLEAKGILPKAE